MITDLPAGTRVRLIKTGDIIEIAPGKMTASAVPRDALPRSGYFQLALQNDGSFLPILRTDGTHVRLTDQLCRYIGLDVSYDTMRRLINGGFIKCRRIAPNTILLDLESLRAHLEACKDPEFWTEERVKQYRRTVS